MHTSRGAHEHWFTGTSRICFGLCAMCAFVCAEHASTCVHIEAYYSYLLYCRYK